MSWRSQGHTKQVHNISQKFVVFFNYYVNFVLAISRPFYLGVTLWQNLTYFFSDVLAIARTKNLVHNISQKFVVFSTICKLCPGDFQAILFWCDIVPKFLLFFFRCPGDRKDIQSKCTIFHKICCFFQLFVNFVLAISRPFYLGVTLWQNLTYFFFRCPGDRKGKKPSTQYFTKICCFFNYL